MDSALEIVDAQQRHHAVSEVFENGQQNIRSPGLSATTAEFSSSDGPSVVRHFVARAAVHPPHRVTVIREKFPKGYTELPPYLRMTSQPNR